MLLLISDANVLIDIEVGELTAPMFSLDYQFAVPDILFEEEMRAQHPHLVSMGLQTLSLSEADLRRVQRLSQSHPRPSRNDLFALALAFANRCPLLTGDAALRKAAESEQVEVRGSIWLMAEMVGQGRITQTVAKAALQKMRAEGRRLPWDEAERVVMAAG